MPLVENNTQVNENKFKDKNKRKAPLVETYLIKDDSCGFPFKR